MTVLAGAALGGPMSCAPRVGARGPVLRRPARPRARRRPTGRPRGHGVLPARVGVSAAAHAPTVVQVRRRVAVLGSALVLVGMVLVVGLSALGAAGVPAVPAPTAVVQVQRGESLSELAGRVAPAAPAAAVAEQIRELNRLPGSAVRAGQALVVPVG